MPSIRPLVSSLAAVVLACGTYLALDAAGDPGPVGLEGARAAAMIPAAVEQPPLPKLRPRLVEPVAGETAGDVGDSAGVAIEEEEGRDEAPTRAASTSRRRPRLNRGASASVGTATVTQDGLAVPPPDAPAGVRAAIEAGNAIARSPYKWGGGHGKWIDTGYDCSGSVSYVLAAAGLLDGPLASGPLMSWGEPGKGKWITIYSNPGHVWMEVAGRRFDTSGAKITGSRWQQELRGEAGYSVRHWPGL